jgi:hypothetical protein
MLKSRELVILFYAVPTIFVILEFYLIPAGNIIKDFGTQMLAWVTILWTMSYLIGGYALFRYHFTIIQRKREGYQFSYLLLLTFIVFLALGLLQSATGGSSGSFPLYDWLWNNALLPLQIAMLSYVGFYTYTVFFRGARSRSWEAGLLLAVSILLMFYSAPYGTAYWYGFESIGNWINSVPNMAGQRAILIGMAIGLIAIFVRTLLGLERAQLGEL